MFLDLYWSSSCFLVSEAQADLCILELDSPNGKKLLQQQLDRHPQRPLIAFSVHDLNIDGVTLLRKPLDVNLLKDTIEEFMVTLPQQLSVKEVPTPKPVPQAHEGLKSAIMAAKASWRRNSLPNSATQARIIHRSCGLTDNIEFDNQSYGSRLYYDPSTHFQHALKSAIEQCRHENRPLRLTMAGEKYIALLPGADIALTNLSDNKLRPRCLLPMRQHQIRIDYPGENETDLLYSDEQATAQNIDGLLWKVTLWSARGRLPLDIEIDTTIGLRQWPNLTRLMAIPQFLRIAALWVKTPLPLSKTAEFLDIEARFVCAFFSACYALGLIQIFPTTENLVTLQNSPKKSIAPSGLLQRILKRLKIA